MIRKASLFESDKSSDWTVCMVVNNFERCLEKIANNIYFSTIRERTFPHTKVYIFVIIGLKLFFTAICSFGLNWFPPASPFNLSLGYHIHNKNKSVKIQIYSPWPKHQEPLLIQLVNATCPFMCYLLKMSRVLYFFCYFPFPKEVSFEGSLVFLLKFSSLDSLTSFFQERRTANWELGGKHIVYAS